MPDPANVNALGAGGTLAAAVLLAWRVMSRTYRGAMADAARMEQRYEGRLTKLDAEVEEMQAKLEACENRDLASRRRIAELERTVTSLGGDLTPS